MNVLRVRALRWMLLGAALAGGLAAFAALQLLTSATGRRDTGVLPAALNASARLEAQRVLQELERALRDVGIPLDQAVQLEGGSGLEAPVPWRPGLCSLAWPPGVNRAGLVQDGVPVGWVDVTSGRCVDRLGALAAQALSGPPFPAEKEVARAAQAVLAGTQAAQEGRVHVVTAYREGTAAVVRVATRRGTRVAWAELSLTTLPAPPVTPDVRLDTLLRRGPVEVGYVHGGPVAAALSGALATIRGGTGRALDLEGVARESAAQAVLAVLDVKEDDGRWALGSAQVDWEGLQVLVVASCPWPASAAWQAAVALAAGVLAALGMLLLQVLTARKLAGALWTTAQEVREAWLGLREDDVGSAEDRQRALALLDALVHGTRDALEAAFGRTQRFWAPSPVGRLLHLLRERLAEKK